MPVIGGSLLVGSNNLYDLGATASRMRKLWSTDGDFSGALTVATRPLVSSPTAGNALTWDSTGLYVAAGAIPPNAALTNPIVRDTIQWGASPAGAVDALWRRDAAGSLSVAQPGAAGSSSRGVQIAMLAGSGVAPATGAASLIWGIDTTIRWLMQMTPNSGPLVLYDYGADGSTFQERLRFAHLGDIQVSGPVTKPVWFKTLYSGGATATWLGQAVPGTSTAARLDLTANLYYNGTDWTREVTTSPAALLSFLPTAGNVQSCLVGMWDVPEGATAVLKERFNLTRAGSLGLGDTNGIGGIPLHAENRVIKLGGTGILEANGTSTYVSIADNYYFSSAAIGSTITNTPSSYLQQAAGVLTFANALATAPSVSVAQRTRFTVDMNGTSSFFSDGANVSIDARNQIRVRPGASNLAGIWYMSGDAVDRVFEGLDSGSTTSWRIYAPAIGNVITMGLTDGYVSFARGVGISGALTVTGTVTGNGSVFNLASPANIQFSPAGTIVHPSGHNTIHLGWAGLNWADVYAVTYRSDGQMNINPGFHCIIQTANGGWIYERSTGHTFFDGSAGAIVAPEIDNKLICGGTGNRWQYIAAVNGGINTCYAHEKEIVSEIVPDEALDAVLNSPMFLFHPKDFEGTVDEKLTFAGPVNTSVDPKLQIGEGALTAAGHQAAYALASIQSLNAKLALALERIAQLEGKLHER